MARSVAKVLVENKGFNAKDMAKKFCEEYFKELIRGYGGGVITVFIKLSEAQFVDVKKPAGEQFDGGGSYRNGGAMRIVPASLFAYKDNDHMKLSVGTDVSAYRSVPAALYSFLRASKEMKDLEKLKQLPFTVPYQLDHENTLNAHCESKDREVNLAIVEYTNGKVCIGMVEDNSLTYCHKPFGMIKNNTFVHQPTKFSFILNRKDKQILDKNYVIVNIKGRIIDDQIKLDVLSLPVEKLLHEIQNYIS